MGRYVILFSYLVLGFLTGNGGQKLLKGWILIEVSIERGVCNVWNLEWKRKDVEYGSSDGRATMFASTFFETLSSGNSKHDRIKRVFGMLRGLGMSCQCDFVEVFLSLLAFSWKSPTTVVLSSIFNDRK